ncbi:endonuclease/exonuclease/phosphatase family protein [Clostridium bornimense]|uniref:endonuclease/exonuclease/phosphatase family protein n=1 Tax=Clostridium bornimense TaxID=1216932 RepID=UPI001C10F362|nr:endonuclease/exonuclease/phosphatase family protein [Clostridium bornimense]MBU5314970.1 endonuclease/exonuclease/phosphatase family protein [Clostridium bornimense]
MKLLTVNCHSWQESDQEKKIGILADRIKREKYDVITLQEVSQLIESEVLYENIKKDNYLVVLNEALKSIGCNDYSFVWDYSHIGYDIYEEGIGILTRHPIVNTESFFISKGKDRSYWKTRKILKATVDIDGTETDFYTCHLGWWEDEEEPFKYQADKLLSKDSKDRLAFFMGDFNNNANVRNEGYDYMISKGLKDTFILAKEKDSGVTVKGKIAGWEENKVDMRLDIIFANKEISVKNSAVVFNGDNEAVISDHYGVEVTI